MKRQSKDIILNAIKGLGKTLNKYPYYFVNEEDVRAELYHKLSTHFKHKIRLKSNHSEMISNAIHSDAIIIDKNNKVHQPDLLVYYTHKKIPIKLKNGRIHFFANIRQSEGRIKNNIEKRRLIEIKISKHETRGKSGIYRKLLRDFNKRKKLGFEKTYLIFIDRGLKIDEKTKEDIRNLTTKNEKFIIFYVGCPIEKFKKRQIFYFRKGTCTSI